MKYLHLYEYLRPRRLIGGINTLVPPIINTEKPDFVIKSEQLESDVSDIISDTFMDLKIDIKTDFINTSDILQDIINKVVITHINHISDNNFISFEDEMDKSQYDVFKNRNQKFYDDKIEFIQSAKSLIYRLRNNGYQVKGFLSPTNLRFMYAKRDIPFSSDLESKWSINREDSRLRMPRRRVVGPIPR